MSLSLLLLPCGITSCNAVDLLPKKAHEIKLESTGARQMATYQPLARYHTWSVRTLRAPISSSNFHSRIYWSVTITVSSFG